MLDFIVNDIDTTEDVVIGLGLIHHNLGSTIIKVDSRNELIEIFNNQYSNMNGYYGFRFIEFGSDEYFKYLPLLED